MCLIFIAGASLRPSLALADILQKSKVSCSAGKTYWRKLEMRASFTFSLGTACKLRLYCWPLPVLHRSQAAAASTPGLLSPQSWLRPAGWASWLGLRPASSLWTCCAITGLSLSLAFSWAKRASPHPPASWSGLSSHLPWHCSHLPSQSKQPLLSPDTATLNPPPHPMLQNLVTWSF